MAIPETYRIEDVAEDAGKGLQPDLAIGLHARFGKMPTHPGGQIRSVACPIVARTDAHQATAIYTKPPSIKIFQPIKIEPYAEHRVNKTVVRRPQPFMHNPLNQQQGGT
ncbi:hypothetical protein GCM10027278_38720 [Paralcaligenes ginsengisoli]